MQTAWACAQVCSGRHTHVGALGEGEEQSRLRPQNEPPLHVLSLSASQAAMLRDDRVVPARYTHPEGLQKLSAPAGICLHWSHPHTQTSTAAEPGQHRKPCERVAHHIAPSQPHHRLPFWTQLSFHAALWLLLQGITHSPSPHQCNRYLRSSHCQVSKHLLPWTSVAVESHVQN